MRPRDRRSLICFLFRSIPRVSFAFFARRINVTRAIGDARPGIVDPITRPDSVSTLLDLILSTAMAAAAIVAAATAAAAVRFRAFPLDGSTYIVCNYILYGVAPITLPRK